MNRPAFDPISLECKDVACARGGIGVVGGVSFKVSDGKALLIYGANGAGKSSLLGAIAGRVPLTEGELIWSHQEEEISRRQAATQMAILDHNGTIKPGLTAQENLAFWCNIYGKPKTGIAPAAAQAGISKLMHRRAATLSAGQKRRLSFARILLSERPVWLLDEPTSSIDVTGKADISAMIESHLGRGGLAIIATHETLDVSSQNLRIG